MLRPAVRPLRGWLAATSRARVVLDVLRARRAARRARRRGARRVVDGRAVGAQPREERRHGRAHPPVGVARLSDNGLTSSGRSRPRPAAVVRGARRLGLLPHRRGVRGDGARRRARPSAAAAGARVVHARVGRDRRRAHGVGLRGRVAAALLHVGGRASETVVGDTLTDPLAGALGVPYAELPRDAILAVVAATVLPLCRARRRAPLAARAARASRAPASPRSRSPAPARRVVRGRRRFTT